VPTNQKRRICKNYFSKKKREKQFDLVIFQIFLILLRFVVILKRYIVKAFANQFLRNKWHYDEIIIKKMLLLRVSCQEIYLLHLLENTFDRKRIYVNPTSYPKSNSRPNTNLNPNSNPNPPPKAQ